MPRVINYPKTLKPYLFHGVDLKWEEGDSQAVATCPFCGRDGKFYISALPEDSGMWDCKSCAAGTDRGGGNLYTFLRLMMSEGREDGIEQLVEHRKLLTADTVRAWGLKKSLLLDNWLVPGYNAEGKIVQVYRYLYNNSEQRWMLLPTPELHHGLHGVNLYDSAKPDVYLCEGIWDAMALWEVMRMAKLEEDKTLSLTGNASTCLYAGANILAAPSCKVFQENWTILFAGKYVRTLYDNDHPRISPSTQKMIEPAAWSGSRAVHQKLSAAEEQPAELKFLAWGGKDRSHDPELPHGFDLRDALVSQGQQLPERIQCLTRIIHKIEPIPGDWVQGRSDEARDNGKPEIDCIPCHQYSVMNNAWKIAMKWTEGLDRALSVMLASVISTKLLGDQLWVKILGPASCLDGDTLIYDPVDKTILTVRERWKKRERFNVLSLDKDGEIVTKQAFKPERFNPISMYQITFKSGLVLRVTSGHRLWNGKEYVYLPTIMENMVEESTYELPAFPLQGKKRITEIIVKIECIGEREYFDFHVPETNNYWCEGLFHHNCGKSTLCEALSVNKRYVLAKSTIRGFHSGYKSDKDGTEDNSLIAQLYDKTLVTKDGDTLLQSPNLGQILSEARDIYDTTSRTHYRHKLSRDYSGVRMTWLLCGTASLKAIDQSELGERFLDCVIVDHIDPQLEDEILWRVIHRVERNLNCEADGKLETQQDPDMLKAMQLTGGYISYLRANAPNLLKEVKSTQEAMETIIRLGKFVAYARARPSVKQVERAEREFSARLVSQLMRLAKCLAAVLNKKTLDAEVMRRVKRVAMDTARGPTLDLIEMLLPTGRKGESAAALAIKNNLTEDKQRDYLRFLRKIGVVELYQERLVGNLKGPITWRLTLVMENLYRSIKEQGVTSDQRTH